MKRKKRRIYNKHYRLLDIAVYLVRKHGEKCYFCGEAISEEDIKEDRITIHHVDFNHDNNEIGNLVLAHRSCHKAYHMRINKKLEKLKKLKEREEEVREEIERLKKEIEELKCVHK